MESNGTKSDEDLRTELAAIDAEIGENSHQIQALRDRQAQLKFQREMVVDRLKTNSAEKVLSQNFDGEDFPWSENLRAKLTSVFRLKTLRPFQLATMNAVLSGHDCILVMPTGGGKSLCFQLPAMLSPGKTVVVSPLLALMEDQVMALKHIGVPVEMFSASVDVKVQNRILKDMVSPDSAVKIIYVTPEKLAKSKKMMATIDKMHKAKLITLLAVDEVHCCSQWGHDFRTDYKILGVIKRQFPDIPLLGLTATATSRVTNDVQQMLCLENSLVFRASFNRPNLIYKVRPKSASAQEAVDDIANLIHRHYNGQSGIVYCLSIRESEEVANQLRDRGVEARPYHASMEMEDRSQVHRHWLDNQVQVVVATIAFGMGIDKPNVRFVIHHSLSKSVEGYYQESGRAGRDDQPADCVIFYRLNDVFRLSTMVVAETTGLNHLYTILAYCVDHKRCRRSILAEHFGEAYMSSHCNKMCDVCNPVHAVGGRQHFESVDVSAYCVQLYKIIEQATNLDERLTGLKLVDAWMGKGVPKLRVAEVPTAKFPRVECERLVALLLMDGYLKEEFRYTAYATISYIVAGTRYAKVMKGDHCIMMDMSSAWNKNKKPSSRASDQSATPEKRSSPARSKPTNSKKITPKSSPKVTGSPTSKGTTSVKPCVVNTANSKIRKSPSVVSTLSSTVKKLEARPQVIRISDSDTDPDLDFGEWSQSKKAPKKVVKKVDTIDLVRPSDDDELVRLDGDVGSQKAKKVKTGRSADSGDPRGGDSKQPSKKFKS